MEHAFPTDVFVLNLGRVSSICQMLSQGNEVHRNNCTVDADINSTTLKPCHKMAVVQRRDSKIDAYERSPIGHCKEEHLRIERWTPGRLGCVGAVPPLG